MIMGEHLLNLDWFLDFLSGFPFGGVLCPVVVEELKGVVDLLILSLLSPDLKIVS